MTTGEADTVYHVMFEEMSTAVASVGTPEQQDRWFEMVTQNRVRDFNEMSTIFTST